MDMDTDMDGMLSEKNSDRIPCEHCSKTFKSQKCFTNHQMREHGVRSESDAVKVHGCTSCLMVFKTASILKKHMLTHMAEKPFPCQHCEKSFCWKFELDVHTRTHTGERPYACTKCDKSFIQNNLLLKHLRTHEDHRTYTCNIC